MTTAIPYCDPDACPAAGCDPVVCTGRGVPSNDRLFTRSTEAIPGGVNSSIRAFAAVGGRPYLVARADGPYVFDVEGRRYIDLVQSYGAVILGHAHPAVTRALAAAAADGTSYGAPTPREMKLAETISERVPSCERVRLMNSGTEATSTAVRLARGFTGRDRIVSFHGNFHGATDALLAGGRERSGDARAARDRRRPRRGRRRDARRAVQPGARADGGRGGGDRRAGRGQHGRDRSPAGFPRRAARRVRPGRRAVDLRRGDHRLPPRTRRSPGPLRRPPGHHHVRQGHRRRAADRRRRWPAAT